MWNAQFYRDIKRGAVYASLSSGEYLELSGWTC